VNTQQEIKKILDQKVKQYNKIDFIAKDPICIPHQFKKRHRDSWIFCRHFCLGK
jgi:hypothetical protein